MAPRSSLLTLNNGVEMPALGLGVFQIPREQTAASVESALADGYRLVDTAAAYMNETEVGEAIRRSGVDRSELFVTTKLWISDYGRESALQAFQVSLRKLGLDYVDLYLIHWPVPSDFEATVQSYMAMERLLADGKVRAIGVCNFSPKHLEALRARTDVVPAVNQVELHPFFNQRELRDTDKRLGIVTQSWSPIGGAYSRNRGALPRAASHPLEHPVIVDLAEKCGKTPAQVILRWHIEHGLSAIPKSVRPERIAENFDIFDFVLTEEDVAAIDRLDTGRRAGGDPDAVGPNTFRTTIPER